MVGRKRWLVIIGFVTCVVLIACSDQDGLPAGGKAGFKRWCHFFCRDDAAKIEIVSVQKAVCPIKKYGFETDEVWCVVTDPALEVIVETDEGVGYSKQSHFHLQQENGLWFTYGFEDAQAATEFLAVGCKNHSSAAQPVYTPTPGPVPTLIPGFPFALPQSCEEAGKFVKDRTLDRHVRKFYDDAEKVEVVFEIESKAFRQAFPKAHMYVVRISVELGPLSGLGSYYEMVAARKGKFYQMPEDFNRLMFDAGLQVTPENRFDLAQALVVAQSSVDRALQPITCSGGREISGKKHFRYEYTYAIDCHFVYLSRDLEAGFAFLETEKGMQFATGAWLFDYSKPPINFDHVY